MKREIRKFHLLGQFRFPFPYFFQFSPHAPFSFYKNTSLSVLIFLEISASAVLIKRYIHNIHSYIFEQENSHYQSEKKSGKSFSKLVRFFISGKFFLLVVTIAGFDCATDRLPLDWKIIFLTVALTFPPIWSQHWMERCFDTLSASSSSSSSSVDRHSYRFSANTREKKSTNGI